MMMVMCLTNFVPRHYFRYTGKNNIAGRDCTTID